MHSTAVPGTLTAVNFLAHLYLSPPDPASMVGNLLPDLAPGPLDPGLEPRVRQGAINHKRVDAFTDTHPVFARSRARFRSNHGRFSAILTDLFYDHVLAKHWRAYHEQPLADFIGDAHEALANHRHLMPAVMRPIVERMVTQGWMRCYDTPEGMAMILTMMSRRFSQRLGKPVNLAEAVDDLPDIIDALEEDFHEFFPQLIAYVNKPPQTLWNGVPEGYVHQIHPIAQPAVQSSR